MARALFKLRLQVLKSLRSESSNNNNSRSQAWWDDQQTRKQCELSVCVLKCLSQRCLAAQV